MDSIINVLKNIVIVMLIGLASNLYYRIQKANNTKLKELQKIRMQSEEVVRKKEYEIQALKKSIQSEQLRIDKAFAQINQIQLKKQEVETLYVNKIYQINSFDANQLKNYFHEELK